MKFNIGQRVEYRSLRIQGAHTTPLDASRHGKRGVVVAFGPRYPPSAFVRWQVKFDDGDFCDPIEECLFPIDDAADYQRFMERVMKPVDLRTPENAPH